MKIVTFGEIMLRLSPPDHLRFVQAAVFEVTFGGAEANVAATLAQFGLESHFVTRLPEHEIGQAALNHLRRFGVRTEAILRGGDRLGIYFLEHGAGPRPSKVIYDRAHSAFSQAKAENFDWDSILRDAAWFHWSGITPALGPNLQRCLHEACRAAKEAGAVVSCDLNYRAKLWGERRARRVMIPLMEWVDVCIGNEEDAQKALGLPLQGVEVESAQLEESAYFRLLERMKAEFGFRAVALTLRESYSASRNGWSAILLDERQCPTPQRSRRYDIDIVDRVGAGDAFAAGLIYGLLTLNDSRQALEFAVAASCLKHTLPGDFHAVSIAEIEKMAAGSASGRVER